METDKELCEACNHNLKEPDRQWCGLCTQAYIDFYGLSTWTKHNQ